MAPTAGTRLRFKNAHAKKPHQAKKVPSLKNRIRGLERFLVRGGIPDATRRAKKAELEQLKEEHEKKDQVATEKKNAEKYKRPRFFERVKVMRKLRQTKTLIEKVRKTEDKAERAKHEKKFQTYREEMMYIYYYPKTEPYISLFPSAPHPEEKQTRQKEIRAEALARFEKEQPTEAFHQFCFNDGKGKGESGAATDAARPAVELLLKKPTKEMVKKQKKARSKRDKSGEKTRHTPALVDQDDEMLDASKAQDDKESEQEEEEEEEDDFFM
ncbi:hypothetical protein PHYBOEH_003220 [Phytophthora boehmeriae]|uniref:rRNA-processing protein EFG1 n=1 Tax=Phytophthora boehmeriae TaxID=109152 RepID=A0A8T1X4Y6_9STRA|nr:hypothetical protein PHYBOEH_003220 [Phytophthora boehmeriae]